MKKYIKFIIAALIALVFIGTFVFLWMKSRPQSVAYEEFTPTVMDLKKTTVVTGKIEPRNEVSVKPQISGIITEILKEAGQSVQAGEIIAKIKVIPDMQQLSSSESRVRLANVNLKQAMIDYQREKVLFDKGLVSADEYDKVRQTMRQAQEEARSANDNLEVVRDGVSKSNANTSSTLIRSTVSGLILDIPVKVGNTVILSNTFNDGTTIATVANMNDLIFRGNIEKLQAKLEYISPKAVENNGANQFELKAAITGLGRTQLRSGYSANAEIVLAQANHVLTVPESAIEFEGNNTYVYVIKGSGEQQTFERRRVVTGMSDGIHIEIKQGLTMKDKVRGPKKIGEEEAN